MAYYLSSGCNSPGSGRSHKSTTPPESKIQKGTPWRRVENNIIGLTRIGTH